MKKDQPNIVEVTMLKNNEQQEPQDLEFSTIGRNRDRDRDSDRSCDHCSLGHNEEVLELKSESFLF